MPTVPWVRPSHGSVTKPAKGMVPCGLEFLGGGLHEQPDLPMAGVIAEGDGRAIRRADAALGAEDQKFRLAERVRVPAHPGILGQAKEIAAGRVEQKFGIEG